MPRSLRLGCFCIALTTFHCSVFEPPDIEDAGKKDAGDDAMTRPDASGGDGGRGNGDAAGTGGEADASSGGGGSGGEGGSETGGAGGALAMDGGGAGKNDAGDEDSGPFRDDGPWWIVTNEYGCERAATPTKADRPDPRDEGTSLAPIYLAMSRIRSGDSDDDEVLTPNPDAWVDIGLDRDGLCTNSPTCEVNEERVNEPSCKNTVSTPFDGNRCIDNSIGKLFAVGSSSPYVGELFGLGDQDWNCELHRGGFSTILKITEYNGKKYDPRVRLDMYVSTGLQNPPGWKCRESIDSPLRDDWHTFADWLPSAHWKIAQRSISLSADPVGDEVPDSSTFDATAFVRNGYLFAELPEGREFWFNGERTPVPGFRDIMHSPVLLAELVQLPDDTWVIENGTLSFFVLPDEMLRGFREIGFCENMCNSFETVKSYQNTNQDVLLSGEVLADVPCNALSLAIDFDARQATATAADVAPIQAPIECPQPRHPDAPRQGCVCQDDGTTCVVPDGGT